MSATGRQDERVTPGKASAAGHHWQYTERHQSQHAPNVSMNIMVVWRGSRKKGLKTYKRLRENGKIYEHVPFVDGFSYRK
jgi:hypothetical protein